MILCEVEISTVRPYNLRINILVLAKKVNRILATVLKRGNWGLDMLPVVVGIYYPETPRKHMSIRVLL